MVIEYFEIPLTPEPQTFNIEIGENDLNCRLKWNKFIASWVLDIYDRVTNTPIKTSIPLIANKNLLEQFEHLGLGQLYAINSSNINKNPTLNDLGIDSKLIFGVDDGS